MPFIFLSFLFGLFGAQAGAALVEKSVEYRANEFVFEGFLVQDSDLKSASPAVLVVHDWMGLSEKTKQEAREIASLGYVVFAADIYGKGVRPSNQEEAAKQASIYKTDRKLFRERLNAALNALRSQEKVKASQIAAVGYCFGGTGVLELARSGAKLKAVVSFHGGLDSPKPADGKNIKAKVLALHGADDPFVSKEDLAAFESEMSSNKIDWQLIKYGGAVHSFTDKTAGTDNSKGAAYNEAADKRSWLAMKVFLAASL